MPATKQSHTPGSWRVGDAGLTVFGPPNGQPSPETIATVRSRANAALIAAAPDLLAALEDLRKKLRAHVKLDVRKHYSLMVADAAASSAIHQARGE